VKLHEYQAKSILAKDGLPIPPGVLLTSPQDIAGVLGRLTAGPWVVKAQIHAGGRGQAGGILKAQTPSEVTSMVQSLFGKALVTLQTGPRGVVVRKLYVEQSQSVSRELYLACVLDRSKGQPILMASVHGGIDIEVLAQSHPDEIVYAPVDPWTGVQPYQARVFAKRLGLQGQMLVSVTDVIQTVAKTFLAQDASLIEINPLGLTDQGQAIGLDAKMVLDDNALFRHPEAQEWQDPSEENPLDARASKAGVNYIALTGTIGCLVNGAGLAMATMDLIKHHGAEPANFLDVGGGASASQVAEAFRILLSDSNVKGILVNIFGGIVKCDVVASSLVDVAQSMGLNVPLVVRFEGTNVDEGRTILKNSGIALESAINLKEAAEKIVALTKG
jgi:succinyl-CoA synthetase beta subunit